MCHLRSHVAEHAAAAPERWLLDALTPSKSAPVAERAWDFVGVKGRKGVHSTSGGVGPAAASATMPKDKTGPKALANKQKAACLWLRSPWRG